MRAQVGCYAQEGDLPMDVYWQKDGHKLKSSFDLRLSKMDDYSSLLVISSVSAEHSGNYTCVAANSVRTVTASAALVVHVPPQWSEEPMDVSAAVGSAVEVPCLADGSPGPVMAWRKETAKGKWAPVHTVNRTRSRSSASAWSPQHSTWNSKPYSSWQRLPRQSRGLRTFNGHVAKRTAFSSPRSSSASYDEREFHSRDSVNSKSDRISFSPVMGVDFSNSLAFSAIQKSHEGRYLCQATNGVGAGLSKIISITVQEPPRLSTATTTVEVQVGAVATLTCKAFGDPPLTLRWSRDQRELAAASRFMVHHLTDTKDGGSRAVLTIERVTLMDSGAYRCEAANAHGTRSVIFTLIVEDVPGAIQALRVEQVGSRHLSVRWEPPVITAGNITSYVVRYSLQQNDTWSEERVTGGSTNATLQPLNPASWYAVAVAAKNRVGRGDFSTPVTYRTEEEKPGGPPLHVKVTPVSPTSLSVRWDSPDVELSHGRLLGYYLGIARLLDSSSEADVSYNFTTVGSGGLSAPQSTVGGLTPYSRYSIVLRAFNAKGAGPPSAPVEAHTLQDKPSSPPSAVTCTTLSPTRIRVTWSPPPRENANGVIVGYRVSYSPTPQQERWMSPPMPGILSENNTEVFENVQNTTTLLDGLAAWSNYSVSVSAATAAGHSKPSSELLCATKEGVPDAPDRIRAVAVDRQSAAVSWSAPQRPRGRITSYTVHWEAGSGQQDGGQHSVDGDTQHYKIRNLPSHKLIKIWVKAATAAGLSNNSPSTTLTLTEQVGAGVWSVGGNVSAPWRTDVLLECRTAGHPPPGVLWTHNGQQLASRAGSGPLSSARVRWTLAENHTLRLLSVEKGSSGTYRCAATNKFNRDAVEYHLTVMVPPAPPSLHVTMTTSSSVRLQWSVRDDGGSAVTGAALYYRTDHGDTEELAVKEQTVTVSSLACGTRYHLYMTCHNAVGSSDSSDVVQVTTKGGPPVAPPEFQFITQNGSQATLYLSFWQSGGCDITRFVVERKLGDTPWSTVNADIPPTRIFTIQGLDGSPSGRLVRVTAHNAAGATAAVYRLDGNLAIGMDSPWSGAKADQSSTASALWQDVRVVAPTLLCLLLLLCTAVKMALCIRQRRSRLESAKPSGSIPSYAPADAINHQHDDAPIKKDVSEIYERASANSFLNHSARVVSDPEDHSYADIVYQKDPAMMEPCHYGGAVHHFHHHEVSSSVHHFHHHEVSSSVHHFHHHEVNCLVHHFHHHEVSSSVHHFHHHEVSSSVHHFHHHEVSSSVHHFHHHEVAEAPLGGGVRGSPKHFSVLYRQPGGQRPPASDEVGKHDGSVFIQTYHREHQTSSSGTARNMRGNRNIRFLEAVIPNDDLERYSHEPTVK
ncbi:Fibronectin type III [Trinorchestia longiramus]|nr:Fibronectin type III [Trinorchestia longiramus]